MKRTISSVILLSLVLLPTIRAQQEDSGHDDAYRLRDELRKERGDWYHATAEGYVIGVYDSLDYFLGSKFCAPEHVRKGEIVDVVLKYLNDHPEQLHKSRIDVTVDALKASFPCPKKP